MYNYFIKTSNGKIHKYPQPLNWMDSDTFAEFLRSVTNDSTKYVKSWRSKNGKKQKANKRAESRS